MDEYKAGDMNANGKADELFCVQKGGNWGSIYRNSTGSGWTFVYSNNGVGGIAGWGQPVKTDDKVLLGNIDTYDGTNVKDEIMFIQTCTSAGCDYATTEDLNASNQLTWNWSNHNNPNPTGYINDCPVYDASGTNVNYLFVKAHPTDPEYLMAFRKYGCNDYLVNMYRTTYSSNYRIADIPNNNIKKNTITIFPNPNNGIFMADVISSGIDNVTIEVYDILGQLIKSIPNYRLEKDDHTYIKIDMHEVPSGSYIIKYIDANEVQTFKINVNK